MSKKFHERLLQGSGLQTRPFHSQFGAALLKKFGWEEGQGLGKESNGRVECLQIRRREENVGLGHEDASETKAQDQWRNWWDGLYNSMAAKLRETAAEREPSQSTLSSESDGDGPASGVKPLYGKKSFLRATRRAQKKSSVRNDKRSPVLVNHTCAENTGVDTYLRTEHDSDTDSEKGTDTSADQQQNPDRRFSTTACIRSSPAVLSVVEASAIPTGLAGDMNASSTKKKKKRKSDDSEAALNATALVESAADSSSALACTHELQTKKKKKQKSKDFLPAADTEAGDGSAAQLCCEAALRLQCFEACGSVGSCATRRFKQSNLNRGEQGDVQQLNDTASGRGGGEEPSAGDSEMRRKICTKRKGEKDMAGLKEGSRGGERGAEADEDYGNADVRRKKKKRKSNVERADGTAHEKRRKKKQAEAMSAL